MTKKEKIKYELDKIKNITFASSLYGSDLVSKNPVISLKESSKKIVDCATNTLDSIGELCKLLKLS